MPPSASPAEAERLFARRLTDWQPRGGRSSLPWQQTADPYARLVSEVMLQQTQVETVLRYYGRFMERFPDAGSLAQASEDEVLALWAGLGYYSRARNLRKAAQAVVRDFSGKVPSGYASLTALPGVGSSTAAAVAAFVSGERRAMVDGNARRVLSRVFRIGGAPGSAAFERACLGKAEAVLPPREGMAVYTQALMDLGATVCTRTRPACGRCPVADICAARAAGETAHFPERRRRAPKALRFLRMRFFLSPDGMLWLGRRPADGVWGGLWTPPAEWSDEPFGVSFDEADRRDFGERKARLLSEAGERQLLTHLELRMEARLYRLEGGGAPGGLTGFPRDALPGLPAAVLRLLGRLEEAAG